MRERKEKVRGEIMKAWLNSGEEERKSGKDG